MNKAGAALFVMLQYLLPKRLISSLVFRLTRVRLRWFKNLCIRAFCRLYPIRMDEALRPDIADYASFNDFFTPGLRPGIRSLDVPAARIVCPVDGTASPAGHNEAQRARQNPRTAAAAGSRNWVRSRRSGRSGRGSVAAR